MTAVVAPERRRGIALAAALAAIVVVSALAGLSTVAARLAMQETGALVEDAQAQLDRARLRSRLERLAESTPRDALLGETAIAGADTVAGARALQWPWHRLFVIAAGVEVVAELGYAAVPSIPWCAAVVHGGSASIDGLVQADHEFDCADAVLEPGAAALDAFRAALLAAAVLPAAVDTLRLERPESQSRVWRASRIVEIAAGVEVAGLVLAPIVVIRASATVRGGVIALDSMAIEPGAAVVGDRLAVASALAAVSRVVPLGRRGLLRAP